jgi:hypothetical protein
MVCFWCGLVLLGACSGCSKAKTERCKPEDLELIVEQQAAIEIEVDEKYREAQLLQEHLMQEDIKFGRVAA